MPRRAAAPRSACPISLALELLGDPWTLLVVRDLMFRGRHTFADLLAGGEGIASNILTDRLVRLERAGMVTKSASPTDARRYDYRLTEKGHRAGAGPRRAGPVVGRPRAHRRARARAPGHARPRVVLARPAGTAASAGLSAASDDPASCPSTVAEARGSRAPRRHAPSHREPSRAPARASRAACRATRSWTIGGRPRSRTPVSAPRDGSRAPRDARESARRSSRRGRDT